MDSAFDGAAHLDLQRSVSVKFASKVNECRNIGCEFQAAAQISEIVIAL